MKKKIRAGRPKGIGNFTKPTTLRIDPDNEEWMKAYVRNYKRSVFINGAIRNEIGRSGMPTNGYINPKSFPQDAVDN